MYAPNKAEIKCFDICVGKKKTPFFFPHGFLIACF